MPNPVCVDLACGPGAALSHRSAAVNLGLLRRFNVMGYESDVVWPDIALIVELDGRSIHRTRAAFERDRERDRVLQAAGWRVVGVTGHQLHRHARALAADLGRMLATKLS